MPLFFYLYKKNRYNFPLSDALWGFLCCKECVNFVKETQAKIRNCLIPQESHITPAF